MAESEKPYSESGGGTVQQLATNLGWAASVLFCLTGIWLGLGNEYGDWTPSFDRVFFAIIIAGIPFILPFVMNVISIPMLYREQYRPAGLMLLICSCLIAFIIGIVAVRMGNF